MRGCANNPTKNDRAKEVETVSAMTSICRPAKKLAPNAMAQSARNVPPRPSAPDARPPSGATMFAAGSGCAWMLSRIRSRTLTRMWSRMRATSSRACRAASRASRAPTDAASRASSDGKTGAGTVSPAASVANCPEMALSAT